MLCVIVMMIISHGNAQSYHVGGIGDEYMRILQLQGKLDPSISFTSRPNYANNIISQDSVYALIDPSYQPLKYFDSKYFTFKPLMANVIMRYNSMHPYGWNDEGFIKAKGFQTMTRWGVYSKIGPLSFQYMPEYVNQENPPYDISGDFGTIPTNRYEKHFLGQSSIRLNLKSVSLGWSTENLWWGPGIYNSLMMSNNAPGFPHYTFNSLKPINIGIGKIEWQLITGRLNQDSSMPLEVLNLKKFRWNDPKIINGLNISFQPKFFPNIFFGVNRAYQYSEYNLNKVGSSFTQKYLPVFSTIFKADAGDLVEDAIPRDQEISLYTRWLFPKAHSEFYFEYGWNDHKQNFRDFWIDPEHAAIYLLGFKHLVPLKEHKWLEMNAEITQTAQSPDYITRNAGDWYIYENGGYTNEGQILGAGSGIGNNVQTIHLTYFNGLEKLGLKMQRIQNQPITSFANYSVESLGLRPYRWTDIVIGISGQKKIQNLILNSEIQFVNSNNYAWLPTSHFNLFCNLNITYLW
jgi:hypothetical protein